MNLSLSHLNSQAWRLLGRVLPASLTNRVFALYGVTLVVFVGIGLGSFLRHEYQKEVEDPQLAAVMLVEVIAQAVQDSVVIGDYDTVRKTLDKAVLGPTFSTAAFIDVSGAKVLAEDYAKVQGAPPAWLVRWVGEQLYDVNRNVSVGGRDYGILRLQFDAPYVAGDVWSLSLWALGLGLMCLVGGLVLIRWPLARWLGSLDQLRHLVESLGNGTLNAAELVPGDAPTEILRVVEMFNQTALLVRDREASRYKLEVARDAAEQANRAKSQFLANMSHEIRTPMAAIIGLNTLLQSTDLSPLQLDYARKTDDAAKSLLSLLNDILDFSKVEAGKMTLAPRPFRVAQVLRDVSVILLANLGGKDVKLRIQLDPAVPRGLLGDDLRLQQVLINLGGNAIKFTAQGEVLVQVRLLERTAYDARIEFSVRDTGIGIAPGDHATIFAGFSQAEASTTRRFGGTGLGLTISQRLVQLMGGEITVDSVPCQGSTFSFALRLALAKVDTPPVQAVPVDSQPPQRLAGLRVLLVEDNLINQLIAKTLLTQEGAAVTVADNGQLGVEAVARTQPGFDAVLMDLQMPVMDGFQATQAIRHELGLADLPIIAMTANVLKSDREACFAAGMNAHIGKPFELDYLVDALLRSRHPP